MKSRPKIDFLKMSHPNFPNFPDWDKFATDCYAFMDEQEAENKELKRRLDIANRLAIEAIKMIKGK